MYVYLSIIYLVLGNDLFPCQVWAQLGSICIIRGEQEEYKLIDLLHVVLTQETVCLSLLFSRLRPVLSVAEYCLLDHVQNLVVRDLVTLNQDVVLQRQDQKVLQLVLANVSTRQYCNVIHEHVSGMVRKNQGECAWQWSLLQQRIYIYIYICYNYIC